MPANLENSAVATGLEKVSFHSNPKERQYQRMGKLLHTGTHFTHQQGFMLKTLQARLQQYVNRELPDVQAGFRKGREEEESKLPTSAGSKKKQKNYRKTPISASLTMLKSLTMWITTNWKILQEVDIPGHLTGLLRNLYASKEATVRTRHGRMDWFKIRKGVC